MSGLRLSRKRQCALRIEWSRACSADVEEDRAGPQLLTVRGVGDLCHHTGAVTDRLSSSVCDSQEHQLHHVMVWESSSFAAPAASRTLLTAQLPQCYLAIGGCDNGANW